MPMIFYPHEDELEASTLEQKLEVLMEAAERYKAAVLDSAKNNESNLNAKKMLTPREILYAYNWGELAILLRQIRDLNEATPTAKASKADRLTKLAEIYEVLRGAKMPKLEAVRLALMNDVSQIRPGASRVA